MIPEVGYESIDQTERLFIITSGTGSILATLLLSEAHKQDAPQKEAVLTQHEIPHHVGHQTLFSEDEADM
jgi:hypothetical protein